MKKLVAVLLALTLLVTVLAGCGGTPSSTGDQPAGSAPAAEGSAQEPAEEPAQEPAEGSAQEPADEPAAAGDNVFTFGCIADYTNPIGLDMVNSLEAWIAKVNADGGVQIGDTMYTINMIPYDSNSSQSTAAAAVERLVFEDKVDYIISDTNIVDSWLHICEENEVVALVQTLGTDLFNPDWHYCYEVGAKNAMGPSGLKYYFESHPEITHIFGAYPDTNQSDADIFTNTMACVAPNVEVEVISYPADASDLSSVGTKVVASNPDVFFPIGGGPVLDGNVCKAVRQSGFMGPMVSVSPFAAAVILNFLPAEYIDGFINFGLPTEFDPATTELAQQFKDAYAEYYGEWNSPEIVSTTGYFALIAALQQAGTTDKDAVRAVLDNGMEWESPVGSSRMVARPDMGNERTVDSVQDYQLKEIVDGKPVPLEDGYLTIEYATEAFEMYVNYLADNAG